MISVEFNFTPQQMETLTRNLMFLTDEEAAELKISRRFASVQMIPVVAYLDNLSDDLPALRKLRAELALYYDLHQYNVTAAWLELLDALIVARSEGGQ